VSSPTTAISPTTVAPTTAPVTSESTPLGMLVAGSDGVTVLDRDGSPTASLDGEALVVFPDQLGGLVYQLSESDAILRLPAGKTVPVDLAPAGNGSVPVGPGRSPSGDPLFFYLEESADGLAVEAAHLGSGEVTLVTPIGPSVDVTAGGSLVALVDRSDRMCPSLRLVDLESGEVPSPLGDDCLPVAAGVSVSHDGRHLGLFEAGHLQVITVAGGQTVLERPVEGAYMATAGPGGWAVRYPDETLLLSPGGEEWTLPPVDRSGWATPFASPLEVADGATLGATTDPAATAPETTSDACLPPGQVLAGQDLPEPVAATRRTLWELAASCDASGLADLAERDGTVVSFGGSDDPAALWAAAAERGEDPVGLLARLLATSAGHEPAGGLWAWPAVHIDPSNDASWNEVEPILGRAAADEMRRAGAYLGYRVGIAADGTWQFFVAGD
jgi:hypothetical protein